MTPASNGGKVFALRFLLALLFIPRELRDSTFRHWTKETHRRDL